MNLSLNRRQVRLLEIVVGNLLDSEEGFDYQDNRALELALDVFEQASDLLVSGAPVRIYLNTDTLLPDAEPIGVGDTLDYESSYGTRQNVVVVNLYNTDNQPVNMLYVGGVGSIRVRREDGRTFFIDPTQVVEVVR